MNDRTVTEQQVIDAFNKPVPLDERVYLNAIFEALFPELPELPKVGELILVWDDDDHENAEWYKFDKIDRGFILVITPYGNSESFDNYRRQTPTERGEG